MSRYFRRFGRFTNIIYYLIKDLKNFLKHLKCK